MERDDYEEIDKDKDWLLLDDYKDYPGLYCMWDDKGVTLEELGEDVFVIFFEEIGYWIFFVSSFYFSF